MKTIISNFEAECKKAIEHLKHEMGRLRSGRASTSLLEGVTVEYYGSYLPLNQVGNVSTPEPRMLIVQVFDASAVAAVEKAIKNSGLGLNPMIDGSMVRVPVPTLTDERRKELVKTLGKMGEEAKVGVRNHRRDANEALKAKEKAKEIAQDDLKRGETETQKVTDKYNAEIDKLVKEKEKEIQS